MVEVPGVAVNTVPWLGCEVDPAQPPPSVPVIRGMTLVLRLFGFGIRNWSEI